MSDHEMNFFPAPEDNFVMIPNSTVRDPNLSWAAKGLLCYLLSHTKAWKIRPSQLVNFYSGEKKKGQGLDAIKELIKELRKFKYIVYKKSHGKSGYWIHAYYLFKTPCSDEQLKLILPEGDNPPVAKPLEAKPAIIEDYYTEYQDDDDVPAKAGEENMNEKNIVFRHKTKNVVVKKESVVVDYLRKQGYFDHEIAEAFKECEESQPLLKADNHNVIERYLASSINKKREKKQKEKKFNDYRCKTRTHNNQQDSLQRSRESFREEVASYGSAGQQPGIWSFDGEN
jgi:hypothetical protein